MEEIARNNPVLVIDDEEAIRVSFQGFLEDCGYVVHTADNGITGIELFNILDPQLVLVDLRMPGMNGLEVVKYISQHNKYCPVIVVSGTGVIDDAVEAVHYGAWDYITKPIADFSILTHSITKALEKSSLLQENDAYKSKLEKLVEEQTMELTEAHQQLKQQYTELEKAWKKAEENDKLKTAFLANMSHEIRTPMNGILGFAEILKDNNIDVATRNEYLDLIIDCGDRMVGILNDLLDISRIEAGQMELKIEDTNINALLNKLFAFFNPQAKTKKLDFLIDTPLPDNKVIIKTDPIKLNQVLTNLIRNAIKFTFNGSIEFGYRLNQTHLEFFVKDTGIGIDGKFKDSIFNRFVQAESDYTKSYDGAGLGLSISKAFVEMMGGKIWYESTPNKQTSFYFTIPYNAYDSDDTAMENQDENISLTRGKKILLVEDDYPSQLFVCRTLQADGFFVKSLKNGKDAIEEIQHNYDYDLVLMDIKLPGMNGIEATKEIKLLKPNLPVVIQTAYSSEPDKQRALAVGCDAYLVKPVKKNELYKIMEELFNPQTIKTEIKQNRFYNS